MHFFEICIRGYTFCGYNRSTHREWTMRRSIEFVLVSVILLCAVHTDVCLQTANMTWCTRESNTHCGSDASVIHRLTSRFFTATELEFGFEPLETATPNQAHPQNPFFMIIMQSGRVGSTLIQHLLDRCPQVHVAGEILGRANYFKRNGTADHFNASRRPAFEQWLQRSLKLKRLSGFKVEWDTILDALPLMKDRKPSIIYLRRRNRVKKALSFAVARATGNWHSGHPKKPVADMMEINIGAFRYRLDQLEWEDYNAERFIRHHFSGQPILTLDYEAYMGKGNEVMRTVFTFLGISACQRQGRQSKVVKITPRNVSNYISNFEELKDVVAGTPYEAMLTAADEAEAKLYLPKRLDAGLPFRKYSPKLNLERVWSNIDPLSFRNREGFTGRTYLDVDIPELGMVNNRPDASDPRVFLDFPWAD